MVKIPKQMEKHMGRCSYNSLHANFFATADWYYVFSGHRSFDESTWGAFDNNDDIDSVWGFNADKGKVRLTSEVLL